MLFLKVVFWEVHCLAKTWICLTPYTCTERTFDSRPFMYNKIFLKKTLIEFCSLHLYASFGTFCVQIVQFFEAQWVFEKCLKTVKSLFSKENDVDFEFFRKFKVSVTRTINKFGRKRFQKKRKDVSYKLLKDFFSKIFCCTWTDMNVRLAEIRSVHTYGVR